MADRPSRAEQLRRISDQDQRIEALAYELDEVESVLLSRMEKLSNSLDANTQALNSTSNRMFWTAISLLGSLLVAALAALIAIRI